MNNTIFRKKNMDRVSSPEQLNDYVRVSNPGVWLLLAAVIILLIGMCVWGIFGHLDTIISAAAVSENGKTICYIKAEDVSEVAAGMSVRIGGKEYTISDVSSEPVEITGSSDNAVLLSGGFSSGEWAYTAAVSGFSSDGIYEAEIVVESVSPISFLLN